VAMATGAVIGGLGLEAIGRVKVSARLAISATIVFASAALVFSFSNSFALSLVVLLIAGMANLISASTSQAVVQLQAPAERRGRFLGAYAMAANGSRVGSGILVGVLGAWLGVTWAVGIDALLLLLAATTLLIVVVTARRRQLDASASAELGPSERDAVSET